MVERKDPAERTPRQPSSAEPLAQRPVTDYPDVMHTGAQAVVRRDEDGNQVNVLTDRPLTSDESPSSPGVRSEK